MKLWKIIATVGMLVAFFGSVFVLDSDFWKKRIKRSEKSIVFINAMLETTSGEKISMYTSINPSVSFERIILEDKSGDKFRFKFESKIPCQKDEKGRVINKPPK